MAASSTDSWMGLQDGCTVAESEASEAAGDQQALSPAVAEREDGWRSRRRPSTRSCCLPGRDRTPRDRGTVDRTARARRLVCRGRISWPVRTASMMPRACSLPIGTFAVRGMEVVQLTRIARGVLDCLQHPVRRIREQACAGGQQERDAAPGGDQCSADARHACHGVPVRRAGQVGSRWARPKARTRWLASQRPLPSRGEPRWRRGAFSSGRSG